MNLCDKRRELCHEKYTSLNPWPNNQKANRKVRKKIKEAKGEWIEEHCITIDKKDDRKQQ
ncbi:hypothetical protein DPMN_098671 [Dreissena polymorpha]|uniref:Uncharacterized protein n=1 Tax=Dreissena polymorpha TaxID=45954 RepID=A0A9D4LFN3_DREPO|nr:hypothetical protein DPMN_098671 [Dreissena polymorpha]